MMKIRKPLVVGIALATLLAVGGVAAAAHQFSDVPESHTFHEDIAWLAENDITRGCNPPANDEFCPEDNVTRGQMAAFLHRFADSFASAPGPQGPEGPQGPAGPQGEQGPAGQSLVTTALTPLHPTFTNANVVDVPGVAATDGAPDASEMGALLFDPIELEEGTYKIEGTTQFFDFTGEDDTANTEFGVVRAFLDGTALGSSWTSDIPDDGNNAAQAYGALIIDVPAGGGTLELRVVIRGDEAEVGDVAGQAGGNLIVTQFNE
jgi:hypothetical protein